MCILALNIINEKIYVFLWFWFIILAVVTGIDFLARVIIIAMPPIRTRLIRSRLSAPLKDEADLITQRCSIGDWLLVDFLSKNVDMMVFSDVVTKLARELSYGRNRSPQPSESTPMMSWEPSFQIIITFYNLILFAQMATLLLFFTKKNSYELCRINSHAKISRRTKLSEKNTKKFLCSFVVLKRPLLYCNYLVIVPCLREIRRLKAAIKMASPFETWQGSRSYFMIGSIATGNRTWWIWSHRERKNRKFDIFNHWKSKASCCCTVLTFYTEII